MKNFNRILIILLLNFILIQSGYGYQQLLLGGVYTIQNRYDEGFLTAIKLRMPYAPVVTDKWRDAAAQKFRADCPLFCLKSKEIYQFKPTSNEDLVIYFNDDNGKIIQDTPGFGLSNKQYWRIKYVGHGFSQIMNYDSGHCLMSLGFGKQVGASPCKNSQRQQWAIRML